MPRGDQAIEYTTKSLLRQQKYGIIFNLAILSASFSNFLLKKHLFVQNLWHYITFIFFVKLLFDVMQTSFALTSIQIWYKKSFSAVIALTSHSEFYLTTRKMNHLSKREQKEFIHFAERENGRIKSKEK